MSGPQSRLAWGLVLSLFLILCVTISTGQTQSTKEPAEVVRQESDVSTLLPAGSVAYVGWDGSEGHTEAWQRTAAYASLYETGLADVTRKLVEFALQQSGAVSSDVMPLFDQLTNRGVSVAVALPDRSPALPQATVVLHRGKDLLPTIDQFIRRAIGGEIEIETRTLEGRNVSSLIVPNSPGIEFGWWVEGVHVVLAGGIDAVGKTLALAEGREPDITTNPLWQTARSVDDERVVALASWIDFTALRKAFGQMPIPNPNSQAPALSIDRILSAIGLQDLGPLVHRSGYSGEAMWSETTLSAPEPRTGLLTPWGYGTIAIDDLPPMPESMSGFYARSLNWSEMLESLVETFRNIARLGPPEATGQLDEAMAGIRATLGIDLRADLFDPLGNVTCLYADPLQGFMGLGAVLAVSVDDAVRLRTTLSNLLLRLSAHSQGQIIIRSIPKYGREVLVLQFSDVPMAPAVCIDEDWLVLGLTAQSVESFLLRRDGKLPKWKPDTDYADGLRLAEGDLVSISVTDPRETVRSLLSAAPMLLTFVGLGMNQQARMGGPGRPMPIDVEDIPPAELVTAPLFPNVSVCKTDADGMTWRSRTSIPSLPLTTAFGGGSGVAATGTLVALLLPAVQQARVAARRTQSRNNLKQIGLALHNYHDVHKQFPPGTHPNDDLTVEDRFSWMAEILPFIEQSPLFDQLKMDQAWNSEDNIRLTSMQIPVFLNPNLPSNGAAGTTHYVGLAGVGEDAPTLPAGHKRAGVFAYNRATRIRDIVDGTSNTIAVSEAAGNDQSWAAGGRPTIRALTEKPYLNGPDGLGGSFPGGGNVLFCDGSVRFVSENIDPSLMEDMATIAGGEVVGAF